MSEQEKMMRTEILEKLIDNATELEQNDIFRYYFGLSKLYVKEELISEFEEYIIANYCFEKFMEVIKTTAILSYEINNNSDKLIFGKLNDIVVSTDSEILELVTEIIKKYINNGEKISEYLFVGTTSDFIQKQKNKIYKIYN